MNTMDCLICRIISKQDSAYLIYEDQKFICFLDIRPLFLGHALLSPKIHVETIYDLPEDQVGAYFKIVRNIGRAVMKSMNAAGTFLAINNKVSQSIPHLHTHIVPRNKGDGLKGFFWPRLTHLSSAVMLEIQEKIQKNLNLSSTN